MQRSDLGLNHRIVTQQITKGRALKPMNYTPVQTQRCNIHADDSLLLRERNYLSLISLTSKTSGQTTGATGPTVTVAAQENMRLHIKTLNGLTLSEGRTRKQIPQQHKLRLKIKALESLGAIRTTPRISQDASTITSKTMTKKNNDM